MGIAGVDGEGAKELTLDVTGKLLGGITRERVRQLQERGLKQLRKDARYMDAIADHR